MLGELGQRRDRQGEGDPDDGRAELRVRAGGGLGDGARRDGGEVAAGELAKQGAPNAQVNCPDNIIVKLDTTVTCDVSSASGKAGGTVTFAFSSVEGTVDSSSVQTG